MLTDTKNQNFLYFCSMDFLQISVSSPVILCFDDDSIINEHFLLPGQKLTFESIFHVLFLHEFIGYRVYPDPSLRLS